VVDTAYMELFKAEDQVTKVDIMLEVLQSDMGIEKKAFRTMCMVDFSEIFRYLHPTLDFNRFVDKTTFYREQLSARLLFEWLPSEKVLIKEYHNEMIAHFDNVAREAKQWPSCTPKSVKDIQQRLNQETEAAHGEVGVLLRETQKRFVDLVAKDALNEHLVNAVDRLLGLIENRKLIPLGGVGEIDPHYVIDEESEEYRSQLSLMCRYREHAKLYENNKTDTRAILAAKELTEANLKNNTVFVLVSGSKYLFPAFLAVRSKLTDERLGMPFVFIRDLNYVLLRFYYSFMEPDKVFKDSQRVRLLLRRFLSTVSRFRMISRNAIKEEDLDLISRCLTEVKNELFFFSCFPFPLSKVLLGGVIDAIKKEACESVLKEVEGTFANPALLQKRVLEIIQACGKAVESVEKKVNALGGIPT
jgi:hypothetical protein